VFGMVPGPDAHQRPSNPLERADTTGQSNAVFWVGMLPAVPAATVVLLGERLNLPWLMWAGLPVSVVTGVLAARLLGTLAIKRLTTHGPDMLHTMRTGRATAPVTARIAGTSQKGGAIEGLYWGLGSILLIPQGLIPLVFILTGVDARSWFLAMYLPPAYGVPVAVLSMLGGIYLLARALMKRVNNRVGGPRRLLSQCLRGARCARVPRTCRLRR